METIGNIDLIPEHRRVSGPGSSYLMAPLTHISTDRPSRFSDGTFGVLYLAQAFETALFETMYHHARFMAATREAPGWTSQFRELVMDLDGVLEDCTGLDAADPVLAPDDYRAGQVLGRELRACGADGLVYPSVRHAGGMCAGLFYPDLVSAPVQGRHLDYHWDGVRVDYFRDAADRNTVLKFQLT